MSDRDLAQALRALGARLDAEPPPDLTTGVLAALAVAPARVRVPRRRLVLALVVLLVAAATAVAASDTVRGWFAGRGVRIEHVATLPAVTTLPAPGDAGLGRAVPAAEAARILGRPLPVSPRLGAPAAVYAADSPGGALVTERWAARDDLPGPPALPGTGALLTVSALHDPGRPFLLAKELSQRSRVDFPRIPGIGEGAFIAGAPHAVKLFDGTTERFRLAANVLLWEADHRVYRLEAALPEAAMLAIAAGLR